MQDKTIESPSMQQFAKSSYLAGANAAYIEELYDEYLKDPRSLDAEWRSYFDGLANGSGGAVDVSHQEIIAQFRELARHPQVMASAAHEPMAKQGLVDELIAAYRRFGHLNANVNPLGNTETPDARLNLAHHQLAEADLKDVFYTRGVLPMAEAPLSEIFAGLKQTYAGSIGIEYNHINDEVEREWVRNYVEKTLPELKFDAELKRTIFKELTAAEGMEKYLDVKYPGQKRFSLEGGDSLIPMMRELSERARASDVHELIIGMAHRGRLNVLLNILGQSSKELFQEFDGTFDFGLTSGDVKYHRGFSSDIKTKSGAMHLSLAFNPSHLEFISAVAMGSVRARQERQDNIDNKRDYAIGVMLHGDAAFSGQGIVMEVLSMSQTRAYNVGGSIHIIINNQVGFTTSDPEDARSSHYCSDPAKMINVPVFHVNGDDPEAAVAVMQMALDYRLRFHKDVVIDLVCYRRHGHQEVDEPRATQPMMYKIIREHPTTRTLYLQRLLEQGVLTQDQADKMALDYRDKLDEGCYVVDLLREGLSDHHAANWAPYINQEWRVSVDTSVPRDRLLALGHKLEQLPEGFKLQRNVQMIYDARKKMTAGEQPLDWGYAEIMAYAALLEEGAGVRFSGEDAERGTFFHRHAMLHDQNTGARYMPLDHISDTQEKMQIYNSLLSESGALGFEYGYATSDPKSLVCWEAQFGDFANGAQVIIDQFISSGWQKWNRLSGLVMLLPHGQEGMGPEHSSARLERYLQLCAQQNIQVCVPTTPAQIFHLLRRQVIRPYRKPLIIMSPKSLLRHKLAVSSLDDLAKHQLQLLIPEIDDIKPEKVTRIVLCCGKVYYELLEERRERDIDNIVLVRIEQLYPFPYEELKNEFTKYPKALDIVWCQEEPKNQGAWFCTRDRMLKSLPNDDYSLRYTGRRSTAAPAAGYPALHKQQQKQLIDDALNPEKVADKRSKK